MTTVFEKIKAFVAAHSVVFGVASAVSLLFLLGMLVLIPVVLVRLPADYFVSTQRRRTGKTRHHPANAALLFAVKNTLGACLIVLGLIMLVTPGQGLLTILAGIAVSNLPGKYRMERWLVTRRPVWRTVTYLRHKAGVPPMQKPDED